MVADFLTGELVSVVEHDGWPPPRSQQLGTVISVQRSNRDDRMQYVFPFVYYVFANDGTVKGPLFVDELHHV